MDNQGKVFLQHSCLPKDVLRDIYHFWIKNSIPSTDKRSGRNEMNIIKLKYMQIHKRILDFEDENITEFTKIKKSDMKSHMKSQPMLNNKTIRKMHTYFVA